MRSAWKVSVGLFFVICLSALPAADLVGLQAVDTVYFWPMNHAFDQYLAEQVAAERVFQVVVDPKLAGTIATDRIDKSFLEAMDELFPPERIEVAEDKPEGESSKVAGSIEDDFRIKRSANRPKGRPQGTLFLVDVQSRRVVWSTYLKEFDPSPNKLNKQAGGVVERLKKSLAAIYPGS